MNECVREMTAKELIEVSNLDDKEKDVILSRLKEADCRMYERTERYEHELSEQRHLIEAYRTVLKDMIYSNWLSNR